MTNKIDALRTRRASLIRQLDQTMIRRNDHLLRFVAAQNKATAIDAELAVIDRQLMQSVDYDPTDRLDYQMENWAANNESQMS